MRTRSKSMSAATQATASGQSHGCMAQHARCGLTGRSTGAPTAGHLAREALHAYPAPRWQGVQPLSPG